MRYDRLRLRNFKPYESVDLALSDGVTVVHGVNGSGKSSLLEAAFFALYGATALRGTRESVITKGADGSEVTLWFTHDGAEYRIERELTDYGDRVRHDCVLEGPDRTVEGATDVEAYVADLLRMDATAFVNCAYVRQGEVNKLIDATPAERQRMIDELLQLGRLEEYRDRAGDARLGVEDVLAGKRELLAERTERIDEMETEGLHESLNERESALAETEAEIERFESNREQARESLVDAREILETHEKRREELATVEAEIEELESGIETAEREREELATEAREAEERAAALDERIEGLREVVELSAHADADDPVAARRAALVTEREAASERIGRLGGEVGRLGDRAEELAAEAADLRERATERRERAAELAERADERASEAVAALPDDGLDAAETRLRERFADAPVEPETAERHRESVAADLEAARERRNEAAERLATARSRVEEAESLREAGRCPECGQPVEGSPHVESLARRREAVERLAGELSAAEAAVERHEERLSSAESLVEAAGRLETLAARRESVKSARERAAEARADATEREEAADERAAEAESVRERAAERRRELGAANERKGELTEAIERVDELAEATADREAARERAQRAREERTALAERNAERRERLTERRERRDTLREAVDEERVATAREEAERAESYLERVEEKLSELGERRDAIRDDLARIEGRIEELERLREEREALAERVAALETLHEETETLETAYGDLRAELRRRNVETLERLLNETFGLVYANDAYARLRLDEDYGLAVVQKDGETLAPDQLSGGERALFNLSLRCAIYRLLAEGIDGTAPMPPLILDEPTVFLDAGHVGRLVDLVEEMRSLGVQQTLIVSHDEELKAAAEELVTVEKDPTTNRSSAHRVERSLAPGDD